MKPIVCDHSRMREINRLRILNLLRREETFSRTGLARETALDAKTITNITSDLLSRKIILSDSYEESGGGRPRELLRLNSSLKYSAGIYLGPREIKGVLIDLKGDVIKEGARALNGHQEFNHVLSLIRSIGRELFHSIPASRLLGLGFVFPGIIDERREESIQSSNLPYLEGINIKEKLKGIFKTQIEIEDSSRAMALAERWFGRARDIDNFVFIDMGIGIGCAILSRGQLHYGASLSAGELGHTVVDIKGPRCRCGHRGCLETIASTREILQKISKKLGHALTFDEAMKINREGNKEVQKIITSAGYYIGIGVSNLVNLLNPSHLIIGGELVSGGDVLFKAIDRAMKRYTVASSYNAVQVIPASLAEEGGALGAATLVLKKVFELRGLE